MRKGRNILFGLLMGCILSAGGVGAASLRVDSIQVEESTQNLPRAIASSKEAMKKWARADADVIQQLGSFLQSLQTGIREGDLSEEEAKEILRVVQYVAEKHQAQMRTNKKQTPYVIHLLGVADQIMRIGKCYDVSVIMASLLHDTVENTDVTYEDIKNLFGSKVASYVKEMNEDPKLSLKERKRLQIVHALSQNKAVAVIKMSDKLHNLTMLKNDPPAGWSAKKIDEYFLWAQAVVDNLPRVNEPLRQALNQTINDYWEHQ